MVKEPERQPLEGEGKGGVRILGLLLSAGPGSLFVATLASVFLAESGIMVIMSGLPGLSTFQTAILDGCILAFVIFPVFYFLVFRPLRTQIIRSRELEERIRHMALHDHLTGLPNRVLFEDRLRVSLEHAKRSRQRVAIMAVDLDKFKWVNDTFGHAGGDSVLKEAARRFEGALRKSDTVARIGGDEFLLLMDTGDKELNEYAVAKKILEAFQAHFLVGEKEVSITPSIGIAIYPEHFDEGEALMEWADKAMYRVKERGGNNYWCGVPPRA